MRMKPTYASLKALLCQSRRRRRRAGPAGKSCAATTALVEGKRITSYGGGCRILKSAGGRLTCADAGRGGPRCLSGRKGRFDGAAARLAKLLDASESRLQPGDQVLTAARTKLRASLNESSSWASQAAVEALAFSLRAAVVPSRGGRYRLEDGDSDVDDGSDSEGDDETSDEAARRARTAAFVEELVEALSTVRCSRCKYSIGGREPSSDGVRGRRRSAGDARLARCFERPAASRRVGAPARILSLLLEASSIGRLYSAGGSSETSTVKPLVDRLSRRSVASSSRLS